MLTQCTGTELNTHELYGDDKLICYGLKCIFYHMLKKLSSKTMKTATSVSAIFSVASKLMLSALSNFMALNARSFTGYILQYKSEEHWKVKIISIAAEGT